MQRRIAAAQLQPHARTGWLPAALGLLTGAGLALLVHAPASWLAAGVAVATAGRVQLLHVQGSVWHGSAVVVLRAEAGGSAAMTWPSRWEWQLWPSLQGLQGQLQAACCTPAPIRLRAGPGGLQIADGLLHMPMAVLQGLGTPWNTVQLQGDLQLRWQDWRIPADAPWQGQLQLQARQVSTRLSTLPAIGSYQLQLQGGAQPDLRVQTLQGPLQIEGSGQLQKGRWRFQGQAWAQPQQAQALANLLNLLGRRSGDRTHIQWNQS